MIKYLVLYRCLSALMLVKVVSMEWFLGVQIQELVNYYNVKFIGENYCCCHDNQTCSSDQTELFTLCKDSSKTSPCETYFLLHVKDCSRGSSCPVIRVYLLNYQSSASMFDNGILSIPFTEMDLGDGSSLMVEVRNYNGWFSDGDLIDSFLLPLSPLNKFNSSNPSNYQGSHGVAMLTVSYGNLTTDPTPRNSVECPMPNTSTQTHQGSTCTHLFDTISTATNCTVTTSTMTNSTVNVTIVTISTVTNISFPAITRSSTSQAATPSTSQQDADKEDTNVTYKILALMFLVVAILLAITSIALGTMLFLTRKSINSVPDPKLTAHEELHVSTLKEPTDDDDDDTIQAQTQEPMNDANNETQEELDCMYSTANKNKKSPCHPNQKFTDIECSTAAAPDESEHMYSAVNKSRKVYDSAIAEKQEDSTV